MSKGMTKSFKLINRTLPKVKAKVWEKGGKKDEVYKIGNTRTIRQY